MAARKYALASDVNALTAQVAALVAALAPAPAPVKAAPVKAEANAFIAYQAARHAARTTTPEGFEACGVHAVCTRSFKVGSNGAATHEPRVYAADGTYTIGS